MPANDESSTLRLFVAVDAPAPVRAALDALPERLRGVTWTPAHQYHLTVRFMGDVELARLDAIAGALATIHVEPFILPVVTVGTFPPGRPPRVIWIGVGDGHPRLHQLRQRIDDALLGAGLTQLDVRTFHPHFTLGRCSEAASPAAVSAFLKKHREFEAPPFRVDAFTLYQSTLGAGGATHTALLRVPLAAR